MSATSSFCRCVKVAVWHAWVLPVSLRRETRRRSHRYRGLRRTGGCRSVGADCRPGDAASAAVAPGVLPDQGGPFTGDGRRLRGAGTGQPHPAGRGGHRGRGDRNGSGRRRREGDPGQGRGRGPVRTARCHCRRGASRDRPLLGSGRREREVLGPRSDRRHEGIPARRPVRDRSGSDGGREVVGGVLGCPNLPSPAGRGCLFVAARGRGACELPFDEDKGAPRRIGVSAVAASGDAAFCESAEAMHSDHDRHARIATRLGVTAPPVRMDSQCKYGAIARGDASIYLRLPRPGPIRRRSGTTRPASSWCPKPVAP